IVGPAHHVHGFPVQLVVGRGGKRGNPQIEAKLEHGTSRFSPARTGLVGRPSANVPRRYSPPMTTIEIPRALHRAEDDLPFVDTGGGVHLQLLQVDVEQGLWVVRTRFEPGTTIPTHKHTGPVHAVTFSGRWKYREYPEVNMAGSYLYEPAGSIHTLTVPDDVTGLTDVWFAIYGANLNLDDDGNVTTVIDAGLMLELYVGMCAAQGVLNPPVVTG